MDWDNDGHLDVIIGNFVGQLLLRINAHEFPDTDIPARVFGS
jgi:hypothetical protein